MILCRLSIGAIRKATRDFLPTKVVPVVQLSKLLGGIPVAKIMQNPCNFVVDLL
jgi:hypothetical protein